MLQKIGTPAKIRMVASNEKEFEALKEEIVNTNNLARCNKCGKLLCKVKENFVSLKRKDIDIIAKVEDIKIKCPVCGECQEINLHE